MSDKAGKESHGWVGEIHDWPLAERTRATEDRLNARVLPAMCAKADPHGPPPGSEREWLEQFEEDWDECLIEQMEEERAMVAAREQYRRENSPEFNI